MIEFLNDTEKNLRELEMSKESVLQLESEIEDTYDLILLSTNHAEYKTFDFNGYSCPIVDSRNCISKKPPKYYQA